MSGQFSDFYNSRDAGVAKRGQDFATSRNSRIERDMRWKQCVAGFSELVKLPNITLLFVGF